MATTEELHAACVKAEAELVEAVRNYDADLAQQKLTALDAAKAEYHAAARADFNASMGEE